MHACIHTIYNCLYVHKHLVLESITKELQTELNELETDVTIRSTNTYQLTKSFKLAHWLTDFLGNPVCPVVT